MTAEREYDLVVLGATGFTGRLVAEYLARRLSGTSAHWAIAGRNPGKLAALATSLEDAGAKVGVVPVDLEDPASVGALAASARVVATTVGPYVRYGEPVVAACVRAGTDYVDITGEPAFVKLVARRYDAEAQRKGARVVNCCGFDSIPPDFGAWFTVRQLPSDRPITVEGYVSASGVLSGGTWGTALEAMGQLTLADVRGGSGATSARTPAARRARAVRPPLGYVQAVDAWSCPLPTIDHAVVVRSARALPEYGPDFRYSHAGRVEHLPVLVAGVTGVVLVAVLAQVRPVRDLLKNLWPSGNGPNEAQRARGRFELNFIGRAGEQTVRTRIRGGDPGYGDTAKMLAESALCLAFDRDRLPDRAGVLTPVVAMGDPLLTRLRQAGIHFEVLSGGGRAGSTGEA